MTVHQHLAATGSPQGLARHSGTWHLSGSHLLGVHLLGTDPTRHADGAGWYDCRLERTPDGWRFSTVRITEVWRAGDPFPHIPEAGCDGRA